MPVIDIYHPRLLPPEGLLAAVCARAGAIVEQPPTHVWCFWHPLGAGCFERPDWHADPARAGPVVRIRCRSVYADTQKRALLAELAQVIADLMQVDLASILILLDVVNSGQLFARGAIWEER